MRTITVLFLSLLSFADQPLAKTEIPKQPREDMFLLEDLESRWITQYLNDALIQSEKEAIKRKLIDTVPVTQTTTPVVIAQVVKPTISEHWIKKIKEFEEFKPHTYRDFCGTLTVGYGFTKHSLPGLSWETEMSKEEADKYLRHLIATRYLPSVLKMVKVPLGENQLGALVSLTYNIGEEGFERSDIRKYLNRGDPWKAAQFFGDYCGFGGEIYECLVQRRVYEKKMFLAGVKND